jgi:hypothetical protein
MFGPMTHVTLVKFKRDPKFDKEGGEEQLHFHNYLNLKKMINSLSLSFRFLNMFEIMMGNSFSLNFTS